MTSTAAAQAREGLNYPVPPNESTRLLVVETYLNARAFVPASLIRSTAFLLKVPVALVELVEDDRVRVLTRHGGDVPSIPRGVAMTTHAILSTQVMVVPNTHADPRFSNNPLVHRDPPVRFYAGAPLITGEGCAIGALCVFDWSPRQISEEATIALAGMALRVMTELDLRVAARRRAAAR